MAGVVVWVLAAGLESVHEKLQARRSPLLPAPATPHIALDETAADHEDSSSAASCTVFTVRDLKGLARDWKIRHCSLEAKARGLEICRREGWRVCWAGRVEEFGTVRRARDEAEWVLKKMMEAVQWTREQGVQKRAYLALPRPKKPRPAHASFPPSLADLPWPLPEAPPLNKYQLTVPRPVFVPPPAYTEDADADEMVVIHGGDVPVYRDQA